MFPLWALLQRIQRPFHLKGQITLPDGIFPLLEEYRAYWEEIKKKMGDLWHDEILITYADGTTEYVPNDRLFIKDDSSPMNPESITAWTNDFVKKYNLPKFTPHSLRHTNASLLIANGINIPTVSKRLGHASVSTTSNIYSHAVKTADEKAANILSEKLNPLNSPDTDIIDAVVAFANTEGGNLYLGVENNGNITGLHKTHRDITRLGAFIANKTVPAVSVRTEIIDFELPVLKIEVPKSRSVIASSEGKIQRRRIKIDGTPENIPMYPYKISSRLSSLSLFDFSAQPVRLSGFRLIPVDINLP